MHVDACLEASRDGGSNPPASIAPNQSGVSVQLEVDGLLHAKDQDGGNHQGRWRVVTDRDLDRLEVCSENV